jgi:CRISPR-associated endoribonuclease Cas6/Csy4 subtype I-F
VNDYFDITLIVEPEDSWFMMTKVFRTLHGVIKPYDGRVGLCFPEWNDFDLGKILRVFGENSVLTEINENPTIRHFAEIGGADLSPVNTARPTDQFVRFVRDRYVEKRKKGFQRRQLKRRKKRGDDNAVVSFEADRRDIKTHYITMESRSTGQLYSLYIKKERCLEPNPGTFNGFGLSRKGGPTLPVF